MQLIEPEYMKKFSCLADACPDTCCSGWDIIFDEAACSRYRESQDTALREDFHQNVLRNEEPAADGTIPFARVKPTNGSPQGRRSWQMAVLPHPSTMGHCSRDLQLAWLKGKIKFLVR